MDSEFSEYTKAREEYSEAILSSGATKRAIIAGPGTGKTFTFHKALEIAGGEGLVLSFINNLVAGLKSNLDSLAYVSTFHGFCRHLLHQIGTDGLSSHFHYYPPLPILFAEDITAILGTSIDSDAVERSFQTLDENSGIIFAALLSGNYYDAVSHNDSVYRVLFHLRNNSADIPSYSLIIVDEYQDFNRLEVKFLELLSLRSPLLVAGDDDQALYPFKYASPDFLREIAQDSDYAVYWLPFCSRCTQVIVAAANRVIEEARNLGLLIHRIDKPFECFMPVKAGDSETYPRIVHARCTVQRNNAPYMCEYVNFKVGQIPPEEIAESRRENYPTVLVAGPPQFIKPIYEYLSQNFADIEFHERERSRIDIIHGYEKLATNPNSRLGWRIILHCDPIENTTATIQASVVHGEELSELLSQEYKQRHILNASILHRLQNSETVSDRELNLLKNACSGSIGEVERLATEAEGQLTLLQDMQSHEEPTGPKIEVTTLVGAKGLDAAHVFLVGISERHFPKDNNNLTDADVCSFLVGLTRARKCCYIVTCDRFGNNPLRPGIFINWIQPFITSEYVDAEYCRRIREVSGE